ncbi:MAG: hypothetical protein R6V19_01605 [Armatimonadota bacterium]
MEQLTAHPRLFAGSDDICNIDNRLQADSAIARGMHRAYRDNVETARSAVVEHKQSGHNWHLVRARHLQKRLLTVLVEYLRTGDSSDLRALALQYLRILQGWEYWSWIDWRSPHFEPQEVYDLSYGEIGMSVAVAYDWLHDELSDDERELFLDLADRHSSAYVKGVQEEAWWTTREYSNWTAVTNGGAGMLALAMWEELDNAGEILQYAEDAIELFFTSADDDGGWPEGVGYWNYGMRYGYLYLLSWENATGKQHPLFSTPAVENLALFPMLFSPHGQGTGFGDVNNFAPMPFHYRVLERIDRREWWRVLDTDAEKTESFDHRNWPRPALYALLGPIDRSDLDEPHTPDNWLLNGIRWGYLSEGMPEPETYMSVRGGTCKVPHGHTDLMALWFQAGDEQLLINAPDGTYLDTTFSERRYELYGCRSQSKNTILLNGVGVTPDATSVTRQFETDDLAGIHVDCSDCFGELGNYGADWVEHCSRSAVNLGDGRYLLADHVRFHNEGQFEARFHTFADVEIHEQEVVSINGETCTAKLRMWASQPVAIRSGISSPVVPTQPADTIIQVQSEALISDLTMVTLIELSTSGEALECEEDDGALTVSRGGEEMIVIPLGADGVPFTPLLEG